MAREYGRIRLSIADDEDVEELSTDAQWLYFRVMIPDPSLNYVGVGDWRPGRLLRKSRDMTLDRLLAAASELEQRSYALFDTVTEEFMCRSLIRSDELIKNPKMAGAVLSSYSKTASRTLRAAVVSEVQKVRKDHPDYSSWTHKDTADGLSKLLGRTNLESVGYGYQIPVPNTDTDPVQNTYPKPVEIGNRDHSTIRSGTLIEIGPEPQSPSNTNTTRHPATGGGFVSTEGHQSPGADSTPPSPNCSRHPNGTTDPCRACGAARYAAEEAATAAALGQAVLRSSEARQRAENRAAAIVECEFCDDDGYRGRAVCDHDAERIRAAEERAARRDAERAEDDAE